MNEFPVSETIADGLAARVPSPHTVEILREVLDDVIEVSEAEIVGAIRCLAETLHQLAEGAGAAALAGALQLHRRLERQRVGVVLSGGNITCSQLLKILHGEVLSADVRGPQLTRTLADMEYGELDSDPRGMTPQ